MVNMVVEDTSDAQHEVELFDIIDKVSVLHLRVVVEILVQMQVAVLPHLPILGNYFYLDLKTETELSICI